MVINSVRVLLVEDNPADVGLIEEAFSDGKLQQEIVVAVDGVIALEMLHRVPPYENQPLPDIILLDLNLPRKDGREVLAELKADEKLREIPVIVLTTSNDEADVHRAYGLHANCYLTKPVDLDDFLCKVRSLESFWLTFVRLPAVRGL